MSKTQRILVIDCQASGIAGDMFLGALIDMGANVENIVSSIRTLEDPKYGYGKIDVNIRKVVRGEFKATNIDVTSETANKRQGKEIISLVEEATTKLSLSMKANQFISKAIHTLVEAEVQLHESPSYDGMLDEVAMVDTAAEIIGSATALDDLGLFDSKTYSTPLAVGGGLLKISHGTVSSPAPATLAILQSKRFPFFGGPIEAELATPTGVSILVNLVDEVNRFYPPIIPLKVGYGAGTKEFVGLPAVLRLTVGSSLE